MTTTTTTSWMNVLPMQKWTTLYDPQGRPELSFILEHYEVVQGVPKFTIQIKKGALRESGVKVVELSPNLSVRLYVPIELHRVPGVGFSPKMVYTFPRGYRIEEYRAEPPPGEAMYQAARAHRIKKVV